MRQLVYGGVLAIGCLGILPSRVSAQAVDMDLMAKWSAVTVVRYAVVGEFAGDPTVLSGALGYNAQAHVTDRVELSFDWNQNETALVGTPTFKNSPSKFSLTPVAGCPPARISGAYDHIEIHSVKQFSSVLQVATTRSYPAGSVPHATETAPCGAEWDAATAKVDTAEIMLLVPPTIYLAMPAAGGSTMSISADRKSMILKDPNNGWTWTYTPTAVR